MLIEPEPGAALSSSRASDCWAPAATAVDQTAKPLMSIEASRVAVDRLPITPQLMASLHGGFLKDAVEGRGFGEGFGRWRIAKAGGVMEAVEPLTALGLVALLTCSRSARKMSRFAP
jgi:hypothetical protein